MSKIIRKDGKYGTWDDSWNNEDKSGNCKIYLNMDEGVNEVIVDRVEGTLTYVVKGKTKVVARDPLLKEGVLYFGLSAYYNGQIVELID